MASNETPAPRPADRLHGSGAMLLTLGGVAATFGVASCCGLPLLLASAGFGVAWLGGVALLAAPHRELLLWVGTLCLGGAGGLLVWRRRGGACAPGGVCAQPVMRWLTVLGLLVGLALLAIGYRYA